MDENQFQYKSCSTIIFGFVNLFFFFLVVLSIPQPLFAQGNIYKLTPELHHLRTTDAREWSDFPQENLLKEFKTRFEAKENQTEFTLRLRQINVKQNWEISLNGVPLTRLHQNEADIIAYFIIPAGILTSGQNELAIQQSNQLPDDIIVGDIQIIQQTVENVLKNGEVIVRVVDRDTGSPLPSRITVVNEHQSLQTIWPSADSLTTVRPGVIYTGTGSANFFLPEGKYTIYAGRGMEYSVDSTAVSITGSDQLFETELSIYRQVDTEGFISSDTHIHTFTHSRHGDASIHERMLTIAGEGIELPIATDHNLHIDFKPAAEKMKIDNYFTPVIGNEVTTPLGHFNVFPVLEKAPPPESNIENWEILFDHIYDTPNASVVIFNHGRDIHGGFRPLDSEFFNEITGTFQKGFNPEFNAMEVLNSGAHQSDIMQLFHDWFAMTNRGYTLTPVAGSDSHDVNRYILGQARTYIEFPDDDVSNMNIPKASERIVQGKVGIGMGLFTTMTVNEMFTAGDLVPVRDSIEVSIRVQGPDWIDADVIELYQNGQIVRSEKISTKSRAGLKWEGSWNLPKLNHDSFLVAIARGPGITKPFWPIARPWEPKSIEWTPEVIGTTGAIWLDEDGNGKRTSAFEYATEVMELSEGFFSELLQQLENFDQAVAIQAAGIFFEEHSNQLPLSEEMHRLIEASAPQVRKGMNMYLDYQKQIGE
ncbi:CehA/McbA family metallohydrolase [Rhodohalobacter sp. 614A]|uniref:CehA/McbA family metallohydrolase n=1 Tax=Rhodohalobacter sp. 614A TaxID=2908649 RepID=UPI001F22C49D|nr:CehA/McbA family metallohydrolase [Rhodohalobacter sp. 614A]